MATAKSLKADVSSVSPSSIALNGGQFTLWTQLMILNHLSDTSGVMLPAEPHAGLEARHIWEGPQCMLKFQLTLWPLRVTTI